MIERSLTERFNELEDRMVSVQSLTKYGTANDMKFYIFDYNPQDELVIRKEVQKLIEINHDIIEFDLYEMMLKIIDEQGYMNDVIQAESDYDKQHLLSEIFQPILSVEEDDNEFLNEFKKVAYNAGVNKIKIVPKIIAAMNNEDSSVLSSHATVGVNIGGGSTDIAILVGDNIINGCTLSLGGRNIDASITEYVENDKGLIISEATSEKIKKEISSLFSNDKSFVQVSGIDKFTNESTDITIVASDIYPIIKNVFDKIILTINSLIKDCSVEIINDIKMTGIYVSGGLSNTTGAKNYLEEKLKLPIHISDTSQNATILGAGKLLNDEARLHNIIIQN